MEKFGENYRGGISLIQCPLCKLHPDNQEMAFKCIKLKNEIDIKGNISDIYQEHIPKETIQTIWKITETRRKLLDNQITPSQ